MAQSKCGACNGARFEAKEIEPSGANYKYTAIQCAACGAVVGVVDYFNTGKLLNDIKRFLRVP